MSQLNSNPPIIGADQAMASLQGLDRPWTASYLAFYSSWQGGILTSDHWLWNVPVDDHMVHRGDGVFEAIKCVGGRLYQFEAHMARLAHSARGIHLVLPADLETIKDIAVATTRAAGRQESMLRIYVSRGPGGFTTNPFECPASGLYIVVGSLGHPAPAKYEKGITAGISRVTARVGFFSSVKTCNYIPNVLLKREAVEKGWDLSIALDDAGFLAEGSTENIGIVDAEGYLSVPLPRAILEGTTVKRALDLAQENLVASGLVKGVRRHMLNENELLGAKEVMFFGTTLDVLPVTKIEANVIGDGQVGPVAKELLKLMRADILENHAHSTAVF